MQRTEEISTLSVHDPLPASRQEGGARVVVKGVGFADSSLTPQAPEDLGIWASGA